MDFLFILILGLLYLIGIPIAVAVLFSRMRSIDKRLLDLFQKTEQLYGRLTNLEEMVPPEPPAATETTTEAPVEAAPEMTPVEAAARLQAPPEVVKRPKPQAKWHLSKEFEQQIAERWMVWLGGLALALGGVFLVKYTIDQGLLGPKMRILLGLLLALAMIATGEWVRRKGSLPDMLSRAPDYVPTALAASRCTSKLHSGFFSWIACNAPES